MVNLDWPGIREPDSLCCFSGRMSNGGWEPMAVLKLDAYITPT